MSMMENTLDRFCVSQGWTSKNKTVKHFLIRRIDNCRSLELSCLKLFFGTSPLWSGFCLFFEVQKLWVPSLYKFWCSGFSPPFIHSKHHGSLGDMTWRHDLIWLGGLKQQLLHGTGNSKSPCCSAWELGDFFRVKNVGLFRFGPRWLKRPKRHFFTRSILWSLSNIFCSKLRVNICFWFFLPSLKLLPNEEFATKTLLEVCWKLFQMCFLVSWHRHLQTAKVCTWIPWTEPLAS